MLEHFTIEQTEDRNKLWHARHKLYYASLALRPGCRSVITDVCVPISRLPEMVELTRKDFDEAGIEGEHPIVLLLLCIAVISYFVKKQ